MLKKSAIVAAGALTLAYGAAQAEVTYYAGGNVSFLNYSDDFVDDDLSLTAIYGRLGGYFNENFSAELRLGTGIGDDSIDILGSSVDVELDNMYGAYFRAGIPVSEMFYPYAVIGYTRAELSASVSGAGSASESDSDTSFGLGADLNLTQNLTVNLEYMNYFDSDGVEIDGFSIGLARRF